MFGNVVFQVALDRTDIGGNYGCGEDIVNNFVASEEAEEVRVAFECVNDAVDALYVSFVVGGSRVVAVDGVPGEWGVDV